MHRLDRWRIAAIVPALIGDLLVWSGAVRRGLSLEALDPGRAARKARLAGARAARGGGA